jgi:uncharacterized protein (TIGR00106 family)
MAIVQFSVVPLGTGSTSLSAYVAQVQLALADCGLSHQLTPMGTVLEGPLEKILPLIARVHELPFAQGARRVMTLINIDDRRDRTASMEAKVASVRQKMEQA